MPFSFWATYTFSFRKKKNGSSNLGQWLQRPLSLPLDDGAIAAYVTKVDLLR